MAQSLEKIFLQKVALIPKDELELAPPTPRNKNSRGRGRKSSGEIIVLEEFELRHPHKYSVLTFVSCHSVVELHL